jgi:glycerol-3-phosphate acyltransferase PlsX
MLINMIGDQIRASPITMLGGLLAKPAFGRVKEQLDPFKVGGVVLLGVRGVVIVAHGRSNEVAMKNAIRQARMAVEGELLVAIEQGLAAYEPPRGGNTQE